MFKNEINYKAFKNQIAKIPDESTGENTGGSGSPEPPEETEHNAWEDIESELCNH